MTGAPQYLLVLYVAEERTSGAVSPGTVAGAVGRSPAATTEMLQRLEARGLVVHEPYEGATLTDEGRERATELYASYRTLSRFFDEVLGVDDHEAEALRIVGSVSPTVTERLARTLLEDDVAGTDPASDPLPSFLGDCRSG